MKQDVREMIKNVIEENAIKFKTSTSTALYQKIGNRLKDEYKNVAKKMFKSLNEAAETSISQGVGAEVSGEAESAVAPPQGPNNRQRGDEPKPGYVNPDPDLERPNTTIDEWMQQRPNINDYDTDGDGRLSNDERAAYEQELRRWYDVYVDLYLRWYHYNRRFNTAPYQRPRSPAWREVVASQPFDPEQARQRRRARERRRS
jgi:hypothetical protein